MAIQYNENIKIAAPVPLDKRYLSTRTSSGAQVPYSSHTEVNTTIILSERYTGLTVNILGIEHWYKNGILDVDLIEKIYDTAIPEGDFVTGGTNIGFFSGYTGIQTLPITNIPNVNYNGNYYSIYNYYYRGTDGIIHTGAPSDGIHRRGYVKTSGLLKSWVWNEYLGSSNLRGWILLDGNISEQLGTFQIGYTYYNGTTTFPYTGSSWTTGLGYNNGSQLVISVVTGSLTTGSTVTIGGPVYSHTANNLMNMRTFLSKTPEFVKVSFDESFVYVSGVTSVINAQNVGGGAGVYAQKTGSTLQLRTFVGSGDTTVNQVGNQIRIFSSSADGSGIAITGATNIGSGIGVFSSNVNRNLQFRSLIGSGNTIINQSGNDVIIYSSGGDIFTDDITVSIAAGKTFGKYLNGDIIPASGKTAQQVIQMALAEALAPTLSLTNLGTGDVSFGQCGKTVNLSFSYIINTVGAYVATTSLQYNRGAGWNVLTTSTGATTYTHNINDSGNRFNTTAIQYRYSVVDSAGGSGSTTITVTPQAYAAPTISSILNGTIVLPETQTVREKGNVISSPSGLIISNRSLVRITAWTLQRRYNGGSYTVLTSGSSLSTLSVIIPSTLDNTIPTSATSIDYLITYTDQYTTGNGGAQSISFKYFSHWGYSASLTLNSAAILALANENFQASQALTWNGVTSPSGQYTYYAYPSTYSDVSSIIKNGVLQDFGAWSQLSQVSVTNTYGESLNYKIWKTNATSAYSGDNLVFS